MKVIINIIIIVRVICVLFLYFEILFFGFLNLFGVKWGNFE